MTDLQAAVAAAADRLGAHASAPALLLQLQTALGELAASATEATEAGRRPFRVPDGWSTQLSAVAYLTYLLADQTGVELDTVLRPILLAAGGGNPGETRDSSDWL